MCVRDDIYLKDSKPNISNGKQENKTVEISVTQPPDFRL